MSVPTETSEVQYAGNDVTTAFAVTFGWLASSQIIVKLMLAGTDVWVTQVEGVDYTLSAVGSPPTSGTVTMTTAPATGDDLLIQRTVPFTQPTAFRSAGPFSAARHENSYDLATFQIQQLLRRVAVLEAGSQALETYEAVRLFTQFTTDSNAVEASFPRNVAMPTGTVAVGARVVRARNITNPGVLFYEPVDIPGWTQTGDNLVLNYVTGLDVATEYLLDIEVLK